MLGGEVPALWSLELDGVRAAEGQLGVDERRAMSMLPSWCSHATSNDDVGTLEAAALTGQGCLLMRSMRFHRNAP